MNKENLLKLVAPVIAIVALVASEFGVVITADGESTIVAAAAVIVTALTGRVKVKG
jgi:hypothetical protein